MEEINIRKFKFRTQNAVQLSVERSAHAAVEGVTTCSRLAVAVPDVHATRSPEADGHGNGHSRPTVRCAERGPTARGISTV